MKTIRTPLLALLGLALATVAHAGPVMPPPVVEPQPTGGPYLTLAGGALWLEDASAFGANLDFDTGYSIMAAIGYRWDYGLALELESGYTNVDSGEVSFHGQHAGVGGTFEQVPIMFNAIYWLPLADRLEVYVGAGTGIVWSSTEVDTIGGLNLNGLGDAGDEWNFAAQGKAGLSYQVCPEASINIGYRIMYGNDAVGGVDDAWGHVLEGGFTWRF